MIGLEPIDPIPTHIHAHIEASGEDGQIIHSQHQSIPIGRRSLCEV